jgi:hypothetical protein
VKEPVPTGENPRRDCNETCAGLTCSAPVRLRGAQCIQLMERTSAVPAGVLEALSATCSVCTPHDEPRRCIVLDLVR